MSQRASTSSIFHSLMTAVLTVAVVVLTFVVLKQSKTFTAPADRQEASEVGPQEPAEPKLLTYVDPNVRPMTHLADDAPTLYRSKLTIHGASTAARYEFSRFEIRNGLSFHFLQVTPPHRDFANTTGTVRLSAQTSDGLRIALRATPRKRGHDFTLTAEDLAPISNVGPVQLTAVWEHDKAPPHERLTTDPITIAIDTQGPSLDSVELLNIEGSKVFIRVGLDGDYAIQSSHFEVAKLGTTAKDAPRDGNGEAATITKIQPVRGGAIIELASPSPGLYRVTLLPTLIDSSGNAAGDGRKQSRQLVIAAGPLPAKHVQFPEFLPTLKQPKSERRANAGDRVETAVVRLFYFRDAHRVAKLVNRTSRALNQAAVTAAQVRAQNARNDADKRTSERQQKEREAIVAAQELRRLEREQRENQQVADELDSQDERLAKRIKEADDRTKALQDKEGDSDSKKAANKKELADLKRDEQYYEERRARIAKRRTRLSKVSRDAVSAARDRAIRTNEEAQQAQRQEDLAKKKQFRREVAFGTANPDTYAPATLKSEDPVAQVSVSVIGEGLIQLRGPRKGIDKIRTMIHQIDAPVGQVKVEVITVQINGEKGERMERPLGKVEAHIGLGRHLTSQSLLLLRKSINEEAAQIAASHGGGHYQRDRDRRYLYAFFGRDFVDELYAMDSEFLRSQNKILGLHSMDTISLHRAMFILALANNNVRQRILARFMSKVRSDLVQAEFDYRRSSELFPHRTNRFLSRHDYDKISQRVAQRVARNAAQRYHFRSLTSFFKSIDCADGETMNPVQREFIRLAQIFKSRMVNELSLRQRIMERTLIEDQRAVDVDEEEATRAQLRPRLLQEATRAQNQELATSRELGTQIGKAYSLASQEVALLRLELVNGKRIRTIVLDLQEYLQQVPTKIKVNTTTKEDIKESLTQVHTEINKAQKIARDYYRDTTKHSLPWQEVILALKEMKTEANRVSDFVENTKIKNNWATFKKNFGDKTRVAIEKARGPIEKITKVVDYQQRLIKVHADLEQMLKYIRVSEFDYKQVTNAADRILAKLRVLEQQHHAKLLTDLTNAINKVVTAANDLYLQKEKFANVKHMLKRTRRSLERKKLLDFLIEEQEKKVIDLLEGTRAQIASMDNYLKRLAIAMEDDFKLQFYDPAFVRIRRAARSWDVTLGAVEKTSILTNNRAFAKVTPAATMEFDLPKRNIAIIESFDAAKALMQDYGALMQDPTFLAAYQLMGGKVNNGKVQSVTPGLPSTSDEQQMGLSKLPAAPNGSALQGLVPDPSIYKFETGTGFEIRPVIQPDGHSIAYDFLYLYTTNVREPVRADEKHLGRIRRHFVRTQVQTSSFELRELSRYQVALKASRTSQGVPLLQDIPGVGMLFRPLPSAESSIQQNVILSKSVVYPTLFELMGLRWAPSVVDLGHVAVRDQEHITRGRHLSLESTVYDQTSRFVDTILDIEHQTPEHYRPDLYHRHRQPSIYHPGGYIYRPKKRQGNPAIKDPREQDHTFRDRRPLDYRQPPYDPRFRRPIRIQELDSALKPPRLSNSRSLTDGKR